MNFADDVVKATLNALMMDANLEITSHPDIGTALKLIYPKKINTWKP